MKTLYLTDMRNVAAYAFPISISQLVRILVPILSTAMVAHLGVLPLAACSLVSSYFIVTALFAFGVIFSITMHAGQKLGAGDDLAATNVLVSGIWLSIILGLVCFCLYFMAPTLLLAMGQSADVVALTHGYFVLLAIAIIPYLLMLALQQFLIAIGKPKLLFRLSVLLTLVALATNYVFVFGMAGIPAWGLTGLGWGYLISSVVVLMATMLCLVNSHQRFPILSMLLPIEWRDIFKLLRLGWPIGANMLVEFAATSFLVVMIGWKSHYGLAAYQVVWQLISLGAMVPFGISQACTALISRALGAKDGALIQRYPLCALTLGLMVIAISSGCYILFNHAVVRLFIQPSSSGELIVSHLVQQMLYISAVYQLFDVLRIVSVGCLRGLHDVHIPLCLSFISFWLIGLPLAAVIGFVLGYGPVAMWFGLAASIIVCAVLVLLRLFNRVRFEKERCACL